jgi:sulfur carrier protein
MSHALAAAPSIRVNGQDEPLSVKTVAGLLAQREISPDMRGVAVALNGEVVARADWPKTPITAGDSIEIVLAKQGG